MHPETSNRSALLKKVLFVDEHFSPDELMVLWQNIEHEHPLVKQHLQQTVNNLKALSPPIKHYTRVAIAEHVMMYTSPVTDTHPRKSLLLCFCGHGGRMTLPTPLFLQCVPQAQFDVVILRDPAKLYYLTGIAQYGDSLDTVLKHLVRDIDFNRYVDVRCLSTSAGGAAALYAGMALGAKRTIAIAGTHPPDEAAKLAGRGRPDLTGMELLPLTVLRQPPTPEPTENVAIFGGKNDLDRTRAQRLKAHIPNLKTVAMGDLEDHMLLQYLAYRQQLPAFFDAYLCPDAPNWGLT